MSLETVLLLTPLLGLPAVGIVALLGGPAGWVMVGVLVTGLFGLVWGGVV